ncbi:MAG TPA: DUF4231 domain-containing protein [Acidobacteriaceae bacterium]|jgi:hypothetical protein|nr:DUF4231 domain-containing protein [Acidobacteriaceae bacterium]
MADTLSTDDPIQARLADQLAWYSAKSRAARTAFKRIKVTEIVAAALIPFLSGQITKQWASMNYVVGGLGILITILEGILHLNQYQENWTNYRNTAESLKHEKFLFLAKAGIYATAADPRLALAERIEALISQENTQWVATVHQAGQGSNAK